MVLGYSKFRRSLVYFYMNLFVPLHFSALGFLKQKPKRIYWKVLLRLFDT